jgi:hypothetical protein
MLQRYVHRIDVEQRHQRGPIPLKTA